jgi:hypothetical protein
MRRLGFGATLYVGSEHEYNDSAGYTSLLLESEYRLKLRSFLIIRSNKCKQGLIGEDVNYLAGAGYKNYGKQLLCWLVWFGGCTVFAASLGCDKRGAKSYEQNNITEEYPALILAIHTFVSWPLPTVYALSKSWRTRTSSSHLSLPQSSAPH